MAQEFGTGRQVQVRQAIREALDQRTAEASSCRPVFEFF